MKTITVIYDDRKMPGRQVRAITGDKSFGETILKRVALSERMHRISLKSKNVYDFIILKDDEDFQKLNQKLISSKTPENSGFFYLYSNFGVKDESEYLSLLAKCSYVEDVYRALCTEAVAAYLLPDRETLFAQEERLTSRVLVADDIDQDAFTDLSLQSNFLAYITGGFDARFFNALEGDSYTVTKKSAKIDKIKSEYNFYGMLPDHMKKWFVMPYDYREDKNGASYTMERIHTTDIAIRFVHGAVGPREMEDILEKLFYFLGSRQQKQVSGQESVAVSDRLYLEKVRERMEELEKYPQYRQFDEMIAMGTSYGGIKELTDAYEELFIRKRDAAGRGKKTKKDVLVIGHGDLCFSNILYSQSAGLIKLIDPKGAMTEEEMYTDPYYDIAKLSHSVCGGYDFFNSGLYQVSLDRDLKWNLNLDTSLEPYRDIFYSYLERDGYDVAYVRICEAGLFLSMLPYHIDQPGKVFGFLLNAIRIMEEVKSV